MKSPKVIKKQNRPLNILIAALSVVVLLFSWAIICHTALEKAVLDNYRPKLSAKSIKAGHKKGGSYDWGEVSDTNLAKMLGSRISGGTQAVGLMTQPKAKVATTIGLGVSNEVLNLSAGTLRSDQKMGKDNYVLAAHHVPATEWALFSGIYYYSKPGQNVYITDLDKVYQYKITNVNFVPANATYIVDKNNYKKEDNGIIPGKPMITLFSCDASGDSRIAEYGTLVKTYKMSDRDIPKEAIDGFNRAADFDWNR